MSSRYLSLVLLRLSWLAAVLFFALPAARLRAADDPVAVFAEVFNGYTRMRLPDHSFKPETYVFGEGGSESQPMKDASPDQMTFLRVARAVAVPLARLNYRQALKTENEQLLILVFWGSTHGSRNHDHSTATEQLTAADGASDAVDSALLQMSLQNEERDQLDARNARILGYGDALDRAHFTSHMTMGQDVLTELGSNRYYVVLQAYDAPVAHKNKKMKPLWTVRMSMDESGQDFAAAMEHMLADAAQFFGRDSGGLKRHIMHEGRVDIGPAKVIEEAPKK